MSKMSVERWFFRTFLNHDLDTQIIKLEQPDFLLYI